MDTFWITEELLKDRTILGLENDTAFANVMLEQVRMNYNRLKSLGNKDIQRSVFILTSRLWLKYFNGIKIQSPLAKALSQNDFLRYRLVLELC